MCSGRYQTLGAKPGATSPRPPPPATLTYADAETKPSARSADATPRTPPPPATSTWPWAGDRPHTAMGTETTHAGAHGQPDDSRRTTTERPSRRAQAAANADATADEENQAVAIRPDEARDDTRHAYGHAIAGGVVTFAVAV